MHSGAVPTITINDFNLSFSVCFCLSVSLFHCLHSIICEVSLKEIQTEHPNLLSCNVLLILRHVTSLAARLSTRSRHQALIPAICKHPSLFLFERAASIQRAQLDVAPLCLSNDKPFFPFSHFFESSFFISAASVLPSVGPTLEQAKRRVSLAVIFLVFISLFDLLPRP